MKKAVFLFVALTVTASAALGQQGQEFLKIVVDDGNITVVEAAGKPVHEGMDRSVRGQAVADVEYLPELAAADELRDGRISGVAEPSLADPADFTLGRGLSDDNLPNLTLDRSETRWEFDPETCILEIATRVVNNGDADAGVSFLGYYLSYDRRIRLSDPRIGDDEIGALTPGSFEDETLVVDLNSVVSDPEFDRDGAYFIGWYLDYKMEVTEERENDNRFNSHKTITCGDQPNLTLDLDHTEWSFDTTECVVTMNSRVLNDGEGAAGPSRLGYYLSEDMSIRKVKDHRIGDDYVGHLDPDEFSRERFDVDLDDIRGIPPFDKDGVFYLGWIVDYQSAVHEADERDNKFHSDTTITCDSDEPILLAASEIELGSSGHSAPEQFQLAQNYPNPFNPETTIQYRVAEASRVTLKIYDLLGREVRTLLDDVRPVGTHSLSWDGRDDRGRLLASGVYIYRLRAGEFSDVRKMTYLK